MASASTSQRNKKSVYTELKLRNLGQEIHKAVPVRLSPFIMTGKAGQSAQFL